MNELFEIHIGNKTGHINIIAENEKAGKIEFNLSISGIIEICHTEVNTKFSGLGYGKLLVNKVVDYARDNGLKIVPTCNFSRSILEKNDEFKDVL